MNDTPDRNEQGPAGAVGVLDASAVRAFHDRLDNPITTGDPWEEARALGELQNAISARLAHLTVTAHETQQARDVPRGIDDTATTRLVGSQVGFARRCTPHRGSVFLNVAHVLVEDMPHTLAALAAGVIGEWDATRVVAEVTGLSRADRANVDAAITDQLGRVAGNRLIAAARAQAYQVDPDGARTRRTHAEAQRRVSLRPAPEGPDPGSWTR